METNTVLKRNFQTVELVKKGEKWVKNGKFCYNSLFSDFVSKGSIFSDL